MWTFMSDEGEDMTYCDVTTGGTLKAINQERNILWTHTRLGISSRIIVGVLWQRSSGLALVGALWLRHLEICFGRFVWKLNCNVVVVSKLFSHC